MKGAKVAIVAVGLGLLGGAAVSAQRAASVAQNLLFGRLRPNIVSGRIVNGTGWHFGNGSSIANSGKEKLTFRGNGGSGSLSYERTTPQEQFSLEAGSEGRLSFSRRTTPDAKAEAAPVTVRFEQAPGEPLSLAIGTEGKQTVYRGATVWHLLLAQPEECGKYLIPTLEELRPQWQLSQAATTLEGELLKVAAAKQLDRRQWAALVQQLGDNHFAKREAADRQLRAVGPRLLGYLQQFDLDQLDAEQQFRVRRIMRSLAQQSAEDTPAQVASWLVEDPAIWLALLTRPDASTRRVAAQRLATILGEQIPVDPAAEPATQKAPLEQLRAKIERGHAAGKTP
jgi:hypothetical protein